MISCFETLRFQLQAAPLQLGDAGRGLAARLAVRRGLPVPPGLILHAGGGVDAEQIENTPPPPPPPPPPLTPPTLLPTLLPTSVVKEELGVKEQEGTAMDQGIGMVGGAEAEDANEQTVMELDANEQTVIELDANHQTVIELE